MSDNSDPQVDNLGPAMEKAVGNDLTRQTNTGSTAEESATSQVLVRVTPTDHDRWKQAAEKQGISMAELVREAVNEVVKDILDCPHPADFRVTYPWSDRCVKCGKRFR